jgi:hypothetical protein
MQSVNLIGHNTISVKYDFGKPGRFFDKVFEKCMTTKRVSFRKFFKNQWTPGTKRGIL